jgi:hypothetical protein
MAGRLLQKPTLVGNLRDQMDVRRAQLEAWTSHSVTFSNFRPVRTFRAAVMAYCTKSRHRSEICDHRSMSEIKPAAPPVEPGSHSPDARADGSHRP